MRSEAQKLQKELEKIVVSHKKGNVSIKMNGANKVEYVEIDGQERTDVKDAFNEVAKDVQKQAAQKMMEMGGGLSGLLGKMGQ